MAKKTEANELSYIDFEWEGSTYTMEFNRRSTEVLEKRLGVNIASTLSGDVEVTDLPNIFAASLLMHHPNMKPSTIETLYSLMGDKQGLMAALVELLANTVNSVFEEPEEGKAISWNRH